MTGDPPEKINYRSIGRGDGGVLRKHRCRFYRDPGCPTPSTIPSQYETVLFKDNREKKGFSSRASRFAEPRSEEGPGPGSYRADDRLLHPAGTGSVGERGANSFASRIPRLGRRQEVGIQVGPGTYEVALPSTAAAASSAHAAPSAVFVQPSSANPAKFNARPSPGPGEYCGPDGVSSGRGAARTAQAYSIPRAGSSTGRGARELENRVPAPPPPAGELSLLSEASATQSGSCSSWARRPLSARRVVSEGPRGDAAAFRLGERLLREGWEALQAGRVDAAARSLAPGPGEYTPNVEAVRGKSDFAQCGSSFFQVGSSHLPRKWRPENPGPCYYEAEVVAPPSPRRAVAFSHAPRFVEAGAAVKVPGPAYYSPKSKPAGESFLLNIQNKWV